MASSKDIKLNLMGDVKTLIIQTDLHNATDLLDNRHYVSVLMKKMFS